MSLRTKIQPRLRRPRLGFRAAICLLVALSATCLSVYKVSLLPPRLQPRALEIGAASTTVLIDAPHSAVTNLATNSDAFGSLQARAALLGNLMTTDPVKAYIGRLTGLAPSRIDASAPITANIPQTMIEPGSGAAATDILANADHYKLQMQVDPTVPILHIYTQAPSAAAAIALAGASVTGLQQYLRHLYVSQNVDPATQVRIEQLGVAHGGIVNGGAKVQIALLTFVTAFALAYCVTLAATRVRTGWRGAGQSVPTLP